MKQKQTSTRLFQKLFIMVLASFAFGANCESPWAIDQCFEELEEGDVILLTLGEQYIREQAGPTPAPATCHEAYGISVGDELRLKVEGFSGVRVCRLAFGEIEGFREFEAERDHEFPLPGGGNLFSGK